MLFDNRSDGRNLDYLVTIGVDIFPTEFLPATPTSLWVVVCDALTLLHRIQGATMPLMAGLTSSLFSTFSFVPLLGGFGHI
jgi:uncharacterized membrane protein YccC